MFSLLVLAAISQAPVNEWRTLTADPRYEVFGRMERGIFRYQPASKRLIRAKQAAPVLNYGLTLPEREHVLGSNDFEVRGTDKDLGRAIAESAIKSEAAPCPGPGPCPIRPRPGPYLPRPPAPLATESIVLIVLVGIFGLFFGIFILAVKLVLLFLLCRWIYRKLTQPPATPTA